MLKPLLGTRGIKSRCTTFMVLAAGLVLSLILPGTVFAQTAVCNGNINLGYSGGPDFAIAGSVYTVEVALGAGTITAGPNNELIVNRFRFQLDCDAAFALGIPCTDEGLLVSYNGDATISPNCGGTTFTSDVPAGGSALNQVTFTPNAPVVIPANTDPLSGCLIEFDVTVDSVPSIDVTPGQIEEVVGYSVVNTDAQCDNGLTTGANQSGAIPVCPACGDPGEECFEDSVCDQDTGQCVNEPSPSSTACEDTGNECAVAGCDGQGNCVQDHTPEPSSTACTDDGSFECAIAGCDGAGACVQDHTPEPASTSCTDTGNECAVAGCDGQGNCDQLHTPEPSSTACADTDLECSIAGCDGAGACVQDHTPEPASTACTDTGNECAVAGCDGAGACDQLHTPEPASTACTDTGNECAVAGCDGAGACDQLHTPEPSSTACTDTGNLCFDAGCDGAGACNQEHTAAPPCNDPTCEECDPELGCVPITPEPAECVDGAICRTPGFWMTHAGDMHPLSQNITQEVIDGADGGSIEVCGEFLDNTSVGSDTSALEAMCNSPKGGNLQQQVVFHLTAAQLNCVIGECSQDILDLIEECNDICANEETGFYNSCIDQLDCFNNGGMWDDVAGECLTGVGFCEPINGEGLIGAICHDGLRCGIGEVCVPLESCHDRDLCPDAHDDGIINDSDFCFEPPGPAGSAQLCVQARKNDVSVP